MLAYRWSEDQKRKRELGFESLQYQINPHFLFNTLNTLKWIAVINDVPVLEDGISSLSSLLQNTLLHKDDAVSVDEEITNLKHYFTIQRIRYADSFNVIYNLDDSLLRYKVPRLILQPLAENSIIHGTAKGLNHINITINCTDYDEDNILLELAEYGSGFDEKEVTSKQINSGKSSKFSGIGLTNVDERLKLYFGADYGLRIFSKIDEGTTIQIIIPKEWQKGTADV